MIRRGHRHLSPTQQLLLQILTLWTLLIAAIVAAMLLPPTADAARDCATPEAQRLCQAGSPWP